jgi:hypothetical protein
MFVVSVNVAAKSKVSFNLTYEELLTRRLSAYHHVISLSPGQVFIMDCFMVHSSLTDSASTAYFKRNDKLIMKDELERMWKEMIVACFSRHCP